MILTDTAHPSDGALLAALHEPSLPEAPAIRQHVTGCARCAARWHELDREDVGVAVLLQQLDGPQPVDAAPPWLQSRRRRLRPALLTGAAAATLAVAAVATIIPGSPLHRWVSGRHDDVRPHVSPVGTPESVPRPAPLASGLSIRAPRSLTVKFRRDQATGVIEITRSDSSDATFRSRGGTTAYRLADGQVSIDNQVPAERYLIDLPASVQRFRISVGHRTVLRWPEDSARLTELRETPPIRVVLDLARPGVL